MKFQQQEAATKRQPVEGRSTPFPFDDLDCDDLPPEKGSLRERMHRAEFDSFPDREIDRAELARALTVILDWLIPANNVTNKPNVLVASCGLRVIALAWSINPSIFGEISQFKLSKRLGVSDSILSRYGQSFTKRFGMLSPRQINNQRVYQKVLKKRMPAPPADLSAN
jgi:hypothetical protein